MQAGRPLRGIGLHADIERRLAADRNRDLGSFARAGFGRREAEAVLGCADPDAVAALLATDRC